MLRKRSRSNAGKSCDVHICTYVCILARFLSDDRLGKHVVKYSGAPLEARSSSGATLDSSLDRSFFLPSLKNFCNDCHADGSLDNDNDGSLNLCKWTVQVSVWLANLKFLAVRVSWSVISLVRMSVLSKGWQSSGAHCAIVAFTS